MFKEAVEEFHDRCAAMMYGSDQTRNKAPDGGVTSTGATSSKSGEMVLSREIAPSDEKEVEKMTRRSIGTAERFGDDDDWRRSPEERDGGATVTEGLVRVARRKFHSLVTGWCDKCGRERKVRAESISWKLGLLTDPMGQAPYMFFTPTQLLVSNSDSFYIKREVSKVIGEKENKLFGFGWYQKKVDLTPNPMGQAHHFIITPPIFTNSGGGFKGKRSAATKVDLFSTMTEMFSHATTTDSLEVFSLTHKISYRKKGAATTLCFRPKNSTENRAFDPGGSSSNSCIVGITKIDAPEATYGGLTALTLNQLFHIYHQLQQYMGLLSIVESFMALLNFYIEVYATSLASLQDHKKLVEIQAWNHTNHQIQGESEVLEEATDLLNECFMSLVGDLTRTLENKSLGFHDTEEENISGFTEFEWHHFMVEHLGCRVESSRMPTAETHHRRWDLGEPYSASCNIGTSCFKLWDPGGKLVAICFWYLHLEDKVNFEGEGVDTNSSHGGQIGEIPKVDERKKWKPLTWGPQCKHSLYCNNLPTWQVRGGENSKIVWGEKIYI